MSMPKICNPLDIPPQAETYWALRDLVPVFDTTVPNAAMNDLLAAMELGTVTAYPGLVSALVDF